MKKINNGHFAILVVLCLLCFSCDKFKGVKFDKLDEELGRRIAGDWKIDKFVYELKEGGTKEEKIENSSFHFGSYKANTDGYAKYTINGTTGKFDFNLSARDDKAPKREFQEGVSVGVIWIANEYPHYEQLLGSHNIVFVDNRMILYQGTYCTNCPPATRLTEIHLSR